MGRAAAEGEDGREGRRAMSKGDAGLTACAVVALLLLVGVVTYVATRDTRNLAWRTEAIKQGHAEYYLDAEHERQWRWLPAPSKKEAPDE